MSPFGEELKRLRRNSQDPQRGGSLTQQRLAELIGHDLENARWPYAQVVSRWEQDTIHTGLNNDRKVLVVVLKVLAECGGLTDIDEANRVLRTGNYAFLSSDEVETVFPDGGMNGSQPSSDWQLRLEAPTYTRLFGIQQAQQEIVDRLTAAEPPWILALEGLGGSGKTALADFTTRQLMTDGAFDELAWVSARPADFDFSGMVRQTEGAVLSVAETVRALAVQLLGPDVGTELLAAEERRQALRQHLSTKPHLVVIDNLETLTDVEKLLPLLQELANPTKFLLTTRQRMPGGGTVYHLPLPALQEPDALALIRHEATVGNLPHVAAASDEELRPLYETVGGNPLALRLSVGQLHLRALDDLVRDWQDAATHDIDALYTFIYWAAWNRLGDDAQQALLAMPMALDQGGGFDLLLAATGLSEPSLRAALDQLVLLSLVNVHGEPNQRLYAIHGLTRTFLYKQVAKWWPR